MAAEAEARIIDLLRSTPGMKTTEIARATQSKTNTTVERLKRLRERGQVAGGGAEGFTASV